MLHYVNDQLNLSTQSPVRNIDHLFKMALEIVLVKTWKRGKTMKLQTFNRKLRGAEIKDVLCIPKEGVLSYYICPPFLNSRKTEINNVLGMMPVK